MRRTDTRRGLALNPLRIKQNMKKKFEKAIKTNDYLNFAFTKPFEVTLRTHDSDDSVAPHTLPCGLMLAVKQKFSDNKFNLLRINPIPRNVKTLKQLEVLNLNNYISLLKKKQFAFIQEPQETVRHTNTNRKIFVGDQIFEVSPQSQKEEVQESNFEEQFSQLEDFSHDEGIKKSLQIGICINVSSEEKSQLKRTLAAVAENIDILISFCVNPDDIFVVILIDGIQSMKTSILRYIYQLQLESQSYFQEIANRETKRKYQKLKEKEKVDLTNIFMEETRLFNRIDSQPQTVYNNYKEIILKRDNANLILGGLNNNQSTNRYTLLEQLAIKQECDLYLAAREKLSYVIPFKISIGIFSADRKEEDQQHLQQLKKQIEKQIIGRRYNIRKDLQQRLRSIKNGAEHLDHLRYINLFFSIKYNPSGKISSRNWFLNGYCSELKPKYVVMINAGVKPESDSIFKMYQSLKRNSNAGGVSSYTKLDRKGGFKLGDIDFITNGASKLFDLRRAEAVSFHFNSLIQRPFEQLTGFIHTIPTSFSAYSMEALRPPGNQDIILSQYLRQNNKENDKKIKPLLLQLKSIIFRFLFPSAFWKQNSNIDSEESVLYNQCLYLAQDYTICLGLQRYGKKIIYLPDSQNQVYPLKMLNQFMQQNKKIQNGYSHSVDQHQGSGIENQNKKSLKFAKLFQSLTGLISYFIPSIIICLTITSFSFLKQVILVDQLADVNSMSSFIFNTASSFSICFYVMLLGGLNIICLHLSPQNQKFKYYLYLFTTLLGLYSLLAFFFIAQELVQALLGKQSFFFSKINNSKYFSQENLLLLFSIYRYSLFALLSALLSPFFFYTLLFCKSDQLYDLFTGWPSLIFYLPSFFIALPIYSKCKLDQLPLNEKLKENESLIKTWLTLKMIYVFKYFVWNLGTLVAFIIASEQLRYCILIVIILLCTILVLIKIILSLLWLICYRFQVALFPYEPTNQEILNASMRSHSRIYDTIDKFKIDLKKIIEENIHNAVQLNVYPQFS